jgi:hypothetical protein
VLFVDLLGALGGAAGWVRSGGDSWLSGITLNESPPARGVSSSDMRASLTPGILKKGFEKGRPAGAFPLTGTTLASVPVLAVSLNPSARAHLT